MLKKIKSFSEDHFMTIKFSTDEAFLTMFLRISKYNVDNACQRFEQNFLVPYRYPDIYSYKLDDEWERSMKMIDQGYGYTLPERDSEGRKVMIIRQGKRDIEEFSSEAALRTMRLCICVAMEEPESQISGFVMIFDYTDMQLKHLFSPMEMKIGMEYLKTTVSFRQKKYLITNISKVSQMAVELCKTFMSEKMKSRISIVGEIENMKSHFQPLSILPKEFGGERPQSEIIKEFKKLCEEKRHLIEPGWVAEIDLKNVPAEKLSGDYQFDDIGSFRKLEID